MNKGKRDMRGRSRTGSAVIRLLCVFALAMLAFGHQSLADAPPRVQFAAYVLPDGKLPTLCINDTGTDPDRHQKPGCDACRLGAAMLMPAPPAVADLAFAFSEEVLRLERDYLVARALYPPSSGPRAPPVHQMFA